MPYTSSTQFYANQSTDSYLAVHTILPRIFELRRPVRPASGTDRSLPIHYRKKAFLCLTEEAYRDLLERISASEETRPWPVNCMHPWCT